MKMLSALALSLALGLGSTAVLHAQDKPGEMPTEKKPVAKPVKGARLTAPWSKMSTLTPELKQQIAAIHKQALADKKAIDAKEEADIMALLSDDQKAEVEKVKEEGAAAKKKTPAKADSTTQPTEPGM